MKVQTVLDHKGSRVATIRPDTVISTAAAQLRLERIGAFVVSDDGRKIQGMLSERDIAHGLAEHGGEVARLHVADLMTHRVITCAPGDSLKHAMFLMTQHRVRHLPVLDGDTLAGIITIGDVMKNRLEEVEMEANILRDAYVAMH